MELDDRLRETEKRREDNWQGLTYKLRKHLDIWGHKHIKPHWTEMKLSYMPVLFNISMSGSTVMDISRKSMLIKQIVSRTTKELEEKGMITGKINKKDKRSEYLELTPAGKQFTLDSTLEVIKLEAIYKDLVGEEHLEIATDVLKKILAYHESQEHDEEDFGD
jgi:DNA-binding MarR family transcriptional regulator